MTFPETYARMISRSIKKSSFYISSKMNNKYPTNDASTSKEKTKIEVVMENLGRWFAKDITLTAS
jgi:hypothetical protein